MTYGDTPDLSSKSLCDTCTFSHITEGPRFKDKRVVCGCMHDYRKEIDFPVKKCNRYKQQNQMDLYEMKNIAHVIEQGKGGKIGFLSPEEARKRHILNGYENEYFPDPIITKV